MLEYSELLPRAHITKLLCVHPDKQNNLKIINKMILNLQHFVADMYVLYAFFFQFTLIKIVLVNEQKRLI